MRACVRGGETVPRNGTICIYNGHGTRLGWWRSMGEHHGRASAAVNALHIHVRTRTHTHMCVHARTAVSLRCRSAPPPHTTTPPPDRPAVDIWREAVVKSC